VREKERQSVVFVCGTHCVCHTQTLHSFAGGVSRVEEGKERD